jgi:aryl-alcohol dehydrogenase-like predicted oxidoreductase
MEYRSLGRSGLQVSVVGLGCNNLGRQVDAETTEAIVNKCLDEGITFFDTADVYGENRGEGMSEVYLGRALKGHRHDVVIASKGGVAMDEGPYWRGGSRRYLTAAVENSLRRLGTDYIDLYQLHSYDNTTPIEETMSVMDDIVRSGKVRYVGCSNFAGWQIVEATWASKTNHLNRFISAQQRYNLLERAVEREFVPACLSQEVAMIPYYPLASGFLTGKYKPGEPAPEGTRLASGIRFYVGILTEKNFDALAKLQTFAQARGRSMVELAIGWLATQPVVGCIITGATKPEQIEENARASSWRLTPEELAEVDQTLGIEAPTRR